MLYHPEEVSIIKDITLINVEYDETATVFISLRTKETSDSGKIRLKKYEGRWLILDDDLETPGGSSLYTQYHHKCHTPPPRIFEKTLIV